MDQALSLALMASVLLIPVLGIVGLFVWQGQKYQQRSEARLEAILVAVKERQEKTEGLVADYTKSERAHLSSMFDLALQMWQQGTDRAIAYQPPAEQLRIGPRGAGITTPEEVNPASRYLMPDVPPQHNGVPHAMRTMIPPDPADALP